MHSSSKNLSDSLHELFIDFVIKLDIAGVKMKTETPRIAIVKNQHLKYTQNDSAETGPYIWVNFFHPTDCQQPGERHFILKKS